MEAEPIPRPWGFVIVALIAALLWGLAATGLGPDASSDGTGSGVPIPSETTS